MQVRSGMSCDEVHLAFYEFVKRRRERRLILKARRGMAIVHQQSKAYLYILAHEFQEEHMASWVNISHTAVIRMLVVQQACE